MADADPDGADGGVDHVQRPAEHVQKIQNANDVRDDLPLDVGIQNVTANVRNTNINVKLGDDRNLIFNTLLTFCVSAMSNALKMNVVQLIVMKFSDNEVVDAKDILCKNSDNILQYQIRKDSQYRSEKFVHAEDIYDGIKKISDANKLPLYVTDGFGLSRLPKIDAEDITNISIAEKIASFERKFATFDDSMTAILLRSLDNSDRISAIERHKSHSHSHSVRSPITKSVPSPTISIGEQLTSDALMPNARSTSGAQMSNTRSTMSTPGPVLLTTNVIGNAVMSPRVEPQVTSHVSDAAVSLSDAPPISHKTAHNTGEHDVSMSTTSGVAVSTIQSTPSSVRTSDAYSNALMSTPPSHGMQVDDVGQFPGLPAQQEQMAALVRQLHMPIVVPTGTANHVTSSSGSVQGPPRDGFALANSHRMGRKMASMRITGKATGFRVRAASPLSNDVFAKKFHKDTTEKELSDYLIANNIIPKSVHVISHVQARTKSFKICCDRENFVKCFDEN